jgi:hypothetical protein
MDTEKKTKRIDFTQFLSKKSVFICVHPWLILKIQPNVHRARRMRDRADGNKIHAGFGN